MQWVFDKPTLSEPRDARDFLERQRWPDGRPVCPHCGEKGRAFRIVGRADSRVAAREGLWKCGACRQQFTVTVGTALQGSRLPLDKWLLAVESMCAGGAVSVAGLCRWLGVTYKSARLLAECVRVQTASSKSRRNGVSVFPLTFDDVVRALLSPKLPAPCDSLEALDKTYAAHQKALAAARRKHEQRADG